MRDWRGQRVLIIGAGRQGTALARYLARQGAEVVLNDRRPAAELAAAREALADLPIRWVTGGHPLEALEGVSLVCPSGGVPLDLPLIQEAVRRDIPLSNEAQVFMEAVPCPVVGITGSAGKTTTTTLVGRMAAAASYSQEGVAKPPDAPTLPKRWRRVWVGGNIGNPLITAVEAMRPEDLVVLELSSFQLELMTRSPQVAVVLNITPNHLDRHGTMEAYTAAKAHIVDFQGPEDWAILGREDPGAWGLRSRIRGRMLTFGLEPPPAGLAGTFVSGPTLRLRTPSGEVQDLFPRQVIRLRGEHNLRNVLAACAVAYALGLTPAHMRAGVAGFGGVPHRLELVRVWRGVAWYNDSIATAPERAMAAMRAFSEPLVLLAGGRDKNLPWEDWARLVRQRVDHLVVFGEAAPKILAALESVPGERPYTVAVCRGVEEAVAEAAAVAEPGDVVLFSPGGTSFDAFRDFEERGTCFRRLVEALP